MGKSSAFRDSIGLRNLTYGVPLAVLLSGLLSIALLLTSTWLRDRLLTDNRERNRALAEADSVFATTHLWIEEYVSGDEVDVRGVLHDFDLALSTVRALLRGGTLPDGTSLPALKDPELRTRCEELEGKAEVFGELSRTRAEGYLEKADVGIGSKLDEQYDQSFRALSAASARLAFGFHRRHAMDQQRSRLTLNGILAGWAFLVIVAAASFAAKERRSRQAEEALAKSEARLLQAQKMEAVGRLAGGVAHDINNYLAAINAQCELVKRKAEPGGKTAERMDAVISTVFKASDLIKRLLAFSRRQPVQPQVVNLNHVVAGLEKMMRQLLREDIELHTILEPDLWSVRLDPAQLEQIIVNLLVNAREAMPEGGKVTLETSNIEQLAPSSGVLSPSPHGYVLLAVTDNGPGIPLEIRDKIFEPFFTTKADSGSSGLGLATVYGIVSQIGGHLWLYSEPGQGTVFKIYLPRTQEAPTETLSSEPTVETHGNERLLLVEDNSEVRSSTRDLLAGLGYEVTTASHADEALQLLGKNNTPFDLLITDVVMPGTSGRELAVRAKTLHPQLPILFISGYTDNVVLRHDILAGDADLLQKPFSSAQLARRVRERLDPKPTENKPGS